MFDSFKLVLCSYGFHHWRTSLIILQKLYVIVKSFCWPVNIPEQCLQEANITSDTSLVCKFTCTVDWEIFVLKIFRR